MADREFTTLVPKVNASVPGCPQPTILNYIRDAAIRTCERTLAWRYLVPTYNLLPGVHEYTYNRPVNADVHAMFEMLVNDYPLDRLVLEEAIRRFPQWADLYSGVSPAVVWGDTPAGTINTYEYNEQVFNGGSDFVMPEAALADASTPQAVCQLSPDKYIVLPLPDNDRTYEVRMFLALKPRRDATGMDEVTFDDLEETIMHGALQHLLVLPNTNWSDRELATYHAKQYTYNVAERRARANIGNMRGMMRTRMQPFGA